MPADLEAWRCGGLGSRAMRRQGHRRGGDTVEFRNELFGGIPKRAHRLGHVRIRSLNHKAHRGSINRQRPHEIVVNHTASVWQIDPRQRGLNLFFGNRHGHAPHKTS